MSERFAFIDALRGIAALSVVLFHAVEGHHIPNLFAALPAFLQIGLEHGGLGVAIFFVISGFVIAHTLSQRNDIGLSGVGRFMLRRSIRLDPPYWAAIAVAIGFSVLASAIVPNRPPDSFTAPQLIAHFFYLQDVLGYKQINPVFWTLCLEVQFYAVFALLLCARNTWLMVAAFAVSLLWPLGLVAAPRGVFVGLWYGFLLGAGAYYAWRYPSARVWWLAYAAVLSWTTDIFRLACVTTALLIFATAVVGQIKVSLNWRWLQFLGAVSYSLYLLHNPITGATFRVGYMITGRTLITEAVWWVASVLICASAARLMLLTIEKPSMRIARQLVFQGP